MKNYYKYELKLGLMNVLSVVLFVIPLILLGIFGYSFNMNYNEGLGMLGLLFYLFLHEIFHAIGYALYAKDKKNIKIGIVLEKGVFYAMCQERISKTGILVSLFFPLLFLSIIPLPFCLIFHIDWLLLYVILNFAGAIGDILMIILIIKAPKDVEYIDYNNDIGAYLISSEDMSNYLSLGFKLTEYGSIKDKKIDKTIKKFYISKPSYTILIIFIIVSILLILL